MEQWRTWFTCPLLDFFGSVSGGECIDNSLVCDGTIDCLNYLGPFSGAQDEGVVCDDDTPSDCEWDASPYGAADCDAAWTDFGLTCAQLEGIYGWICDGCNCPGDDPNLDVLKEHLIVETVSVSLKVTIVMVL